MYVHIYIMNNEYYKSQFGCLIFMDDKKKSINFSVKIVLKTIERVFFKINLNFK